MSDPFGIFAGGLGLATVFTACVDCFTYIQQGRNFGRDYQTYLISLECTKLRLVRWGQSVNILSDPTLGRPNASSQEISIVRDALGQILLLFADVEKIQKKYLPTEETSESALQKTTPKDDGLLRIQTLTKKMKEMALKRQKEMTVLGTASWALHNKNELAGLVSSITSLLDNIERLFPVPLVQGIPAPGQTEGLEIQNLQTERAIELAPNSHQSREKAIHPAGHQYLRVDVKGKAQLGDMMIGDWTGKTSLEHHTYSNISVQEGAAVLIGNKYGGKDFWDD